MVCKQVTLVQNAAKFKENSQIYEFDKKGIAFSRRFVYNVFCSGILDAG